MTQAASPSAARNHFPGLPRFELRRQLGEGSFGTVYEALDHDSSCIVALKHLRLVTADTLYLFKREFRALADLTHPNLVALYELIATQDGDWLLEMEFVEGVDFLSYVTAAQIQEQPASSVASTQVVSRLGIDETSVLTATELDASSAAGARDVTIANLADTVQQLVRQAPREVRVTPWIQVAPARDFERLRETLRQLASGLCALHAAGKLHRDLKPSNILVSAQGRAVLLDFGLVLDATEQEEAGYLVGTPAYMSPEQLRGDSISPASDWYSVGVLLYEALTGRLPHEGTIAQLVVAKQEQDPTPLQQLRADIPAALLMLCDKLLQRDPSARPTGTEVLRWLSGTDFVGTSLHLREQSELIGREQQLAALDVVAQRFRAGQSAVVLLEGLSGMGKTTLARTFLRSQCASDSKLLLLESRCYEQESVPFKALDGIVDMLAMQLRTGNLPDLLQNVQSELVDLGALAMLFPVLRQVPALRDVKAGPSIDARERRNRASATLKLLLGAIVKTRPLLLLIDDLQWGDLDSGELLLELLRPPSPPHLLMVLSLRSDEIQSSPLLCWLYPQLQSFLGSELSVDTIEVGALSAAQAQQLAGALFEEGVASHRLMAALSQDVAPSPFYVAELARYLQEATEAVPAMDGRASIAATDDLLWRRVERLPAAARRALECVTLSGGPILRSTVREAAALGGEELGALHQLRLGHFIRVRHNDTTELLEPYHDRIRQTVVRQLSAEQKRTQHLALARSLEQSHSKDAEALARHFELAEHHDSAGHYVRIAARQAAAALAFERAAELFRKALSWGDATDAALLYAELGEVLAASGRGRDAAESFLAAAERSKGESVQKLRRRAGEQLVRSGYLDAGMTVLRENLARHGIHLPSSTQVSAALGMLRRRYVDLRGLSANLRAEASCHPAELELQDTLFAAMLGFSMSDVARAADLQSRQMLAALRSGEPFRLARTLLLDAAFWSTLGARCHARNQEYIEAAMAIARRYPSAQLDAYVFMSSGVNAYLEGRFFAARYLLKEAEQRMRKFNGVAWEMEVLTRYLLNAEIFLGEFQETLERSDTLLRDALTRDDAYTESTMRPTILYFAELLRDSPDAAWAHAEAAQVRWKNTGFHGQHYWIECAKLEVLLYTGRWSEVLAHVQKEWVRLTMTKMAPFHEFARIMVRHRLGRAALAAAAVSQNPAQQQQQLSVCQALAEKLESEQALWGRALGWHLRAGIGAQQTRGSATETLRWIERARTLCAEVGLSIHVASLDERAGALLGGSAGAARQQAAHAALKERGVQAPMRLLRMMLPHPAHL